MHIDRAELRHKGKCYLMFAGGTVLFNFFQAFDNLFEKVPYGAVDSFAVLFKKIIERNRDFQHLQLFDFLFVFTDFGGDLKLYFCSIGAVGGRLLFLKIPMLQRNGYAQSYELTAAVMGKNKSKRG